MNSVENKGAEQVKAPDTPSHTSPGAEGCKDVLQLLKEQSIKMEKLARALRVFQQGMLRKNPGHVKESVSEATEVLTCADRGEKDVAHASGSSSCPIFRAELRRLRGGKSEVSTAQPREREGSPEPSDADC